MIDTYKDRLGSWREWLYSEGKSRVTILCYIRETGHFIDWLEEQDSPRATPRHARDYKDYLETDRGLSPATINRQLAACRSFFMYLQRYHSLVYNPFAGIQDKRQTKPSPSGLPEKTIRDLLGASEEMVILAKNKDKKTLYPTTREAVRNHAILVFLLYTGARLKETSQLDIKDIELGARSGTVTIKKGKGNKERMLPLAGEARKALAEWIEIRGEQPGPLFLGRKARRLEARGVQRVVQKIGRYARVNVSPHQLRHTAAKRMLRQGVDLPTIQGILGHTSMATTAQYTRPSLEDMQKAVETIGK